MKSWSKSWKIAAAVVLVAAASGVFLWRRASVEDHRKQIAVILPSPSNPFWVEVRRGAEDAKLALERDYDVEIQSSLDMNTNSQVDLLNNFLSRQPPSALVLGPTSDIETVPTVAKYSALNIPIILIDTELNPEALSKHRVAVAAFIGSDNVDGGRKAAKAMAEALHGHQGRVLLIEGSRVHQSAIDRAAGFTEIAAKEGLQVISVPGEWKRDRAQELAASAFARGSVDGIFASNDDMAMGAIAGLKSRGLKPPARPIVIGFDATRDGLAAVANGDMYATIQQDAHRLGQQGVMSAVKAIKHDPTLLRRDLLEVIVRSQ